MKRIVVCALSVLFYTTCAASQSDLSELRQKIDGGGSADAQKNAVILADGKIVAQQINDALPDRGTFYRMSIKPGAKGYPGTTVAFEKPADFSGSDVLGVWFKTDRPVNYFQLAINSANGVSQELGLAAYAAGASSRVLPGKWHLALMPCKAEPGWIRYGDKLDYTRIKSITFYTDALVLPTDAAAQYEFGGMKLYSLEEAKRLAAAQMQAAPPRTAARLIDDQDVLVWTAEPSEKIFKTTAMPASASRARYATASAAGREYASYVFVIKPARRLEKLRVAATDLVGGKSSIPASNATLRYVDNVKGTLLDCPDPLPLMKDAVVATPTEPLLLWATVYVPENTPKGVYEGTIHLQDGSGFKRDLGLAVEVYGFSLPRKTHLKSVFTVQFFYGGLANFVKSYLSHWPAGVRPFNESYKEMIDNVLKDFGEHRITPELFAEQFNHLDFERKRELTRRYRFDPPFTLGYNTVMNYLALRDGKWAPVDVNEAKRRQTREDLAARAQQFRTAGVKDLCFLKVGDEPTADLMNAVRLAAEDAAQAIPDIQRFLVLTEWPEAKYINPLVGKVDTWCVLWGRFDFMGEEALARKRAGDRFWAYAAEYKANNAYEPMDLRIPCWLYWKYGISGIHYSHDVPAVFLTYPNMTYPHSDGLAPIPSIRWEMLRHGLQDYEYLWLLNDLINRSPQKGGKYKRLLEVPPAIAASELVYSSEPTALLNRRAEIASAIEDLAK